MGNSMDTNTGPGVSASGTDPFHARQTAGRTPTSSLHVSKNVSDIQPPDTDQQLADTVNSSVKTSAASGRDVRDVEASACRFGGFLYSAQCKRRNANGATQMANPNPNPDPNPNTDPNRNPNPKPNPNPKSLTHSRCAICIAPNTDSPIRAVLKNGHYR